jgi:hypothetical protein
MPRIMHPAVSELKLVLGSAGASPHCFEDLYPGDYWRNKR